MTNTSESTHPAHPVLCVIEVRDRTDEDLKMAANAYLFLDKANARAIEAARVQINQILADLLHTIGR